jgi:hypothetical protein
VVSDGAPPLNALRAIYAPLDLVFVEGLKESPLRKVVVLDADDAILEAVNLGTVSSIALFVGTRSRHPPLAATYFHRDDIASITRRVLKVLALDAARQTEPRDRGANPGAPASLRLADARVRSVSRERPQLSARPSVRRCQDARSLP